LVATILEEPPAEAGRQVIARAVAVLQTLEAQPVGLSMSQIARESGLPRTTVQRLVGALVAQHFLAVSGSGRVRLGPALARLAGAVHTDVRAVVHPHLEALRQRVRETVHLWAMADDDVVLVEQLVCDHEVCIVTPIGARFPLGCTAGGKAILATLTDTEVRRLTEGRLKACTAHSILSVEALLADLQEVRSQGVAYDLEEHVEDVCAIGTALHTGTADHFALCIAAPVRRFRDNRDRLKQAIIECRDRTNEDICT
jgi:DNA-binding IclR family transcriptional regulator